jgi:hypothetical protein
MFYASYLFQSGQVLIFFLELMAIRPWLTWYQAGVWEGGGSRGLWPAAVLGSGRGGGCVPVLAAA